MGEETPPYFFAIINFIVSMEIRHKNKIHQYCKDEIVFADSWEELILKVRETLVKLKLETDYGAFQFDYPCVELSNDLDQYFIGTAETEKTVEELLKLNSLSIVIKCYKEIK